MNNGRLCLTPFLPLWGFLHHQLSPKNPTLIPNPHTSSPTPSKEPSSIILPSSPKEKKQNQPLSRETIKTPPYPSILDTSYTSMPLFSDCANEECTQTAPKSPEVPLTCESLPNVPDSPDKLPCSQNQSRRSHRIVNIR